MRPNILLELYSKFPEKDWNFTEMSSNPGVTMKLYKENIGWDIARLGENPTLGLLLLEELEIYDKKQRNEFFFGLSKNKALTMKIIEKYMDEKWSWEEISRNIHLDEDTFKAFIKKWKWRYISCNETLKMSMVKSCINEKWIYTVLSKIPTLQLSDSVIREHKFHVHSIATSNVDVRGLIKFLKTSDDYKFFLLSENKHLTAEIIDDFRDKNWDWSIISKNMILDVLTFEKYINMWDPENISGNVNVTMEMIERNISFPWDY